MWRLFPNVGADEKPEFFLLGLNKHLIYIGKLQFLWMHLTTNNILLLH
jgi:hypothetical protein